MNKLIVALIASAFAATAGAQAMQSLETPKDKAKQNTVKEATKVGEQPTPQAEAAQAKKNVEASKKVAKPTAQQRKADVDSATKSAAQAETGASTAAGAAEAKAMKGTPKALPTTKDKAKAVDETTKAKASQ
jgi:hypothetical protein